MMLDTVRTKAAQRLSDLQSAIAIAEHEVSRIETERLSLQRAQDADREEAEVFKQAIAGLNLLMERTVTANLENLQKDVNRALKAIIPDQDLRFQVIPDVKWDKQVYSFAILHDGVPHTDAEGIGGTVLAIVSMVLRLMFILYTRRYPLLVLDESLRFVSKSYKERASRFVQALAREMGVHILLITHDQAFAVAADRNYTVEPGTSTDGSSFTVLKEVTKEDVLAYFQEVA